MAGTTVTSMTEISARLRADDTPTPPASDPAVTDPHDAMDTSSGPSTPTRHSFAGILGQRALPDEQPIKQHDAIHGHDHSDPNHHHLNHDSGRADSTQPGQDGQEIDDDIDMGEGDAETVDDEDLSGNESATSEKPSKKKKGQRFFCTDFPPCQLSFTRSEHLARHIRKHTGERPFQCHCSRRFSRLDNLRQHAQTVHVNEEIPGDSLAATSTRFQRQIRTERVRTTSARASRGSNVTPGAGGQTPTHPRGHSRNLSSSSIGSVTSTFTMPDDRRRPPTLAIATEGLKRPHDMTEDESQYYPQQSGATTPTSAFSTIGSPTYTSAFGSPSRSLYHSGQPHNRRLSVPSTSKPHQQHNAGYASGYYTPISSQASVYSSHQTSGYASPSSSIMSPEGRRDSETEVEYRRRTWHATSHSSYNQRPPTSGLLFHQTPDQPVPAIPELPPMPQLPRLPGIESFDHAPPVNRRPQADTNMLNAMSRPTTSHDAGIQQGLVKLEISSSGARQESQWPQAPPQYAPPSGPLPRIPAAVPFNAFPQQQQPPLPHHNHHHHTLSMPEVPATARRNKRQAWYGGPVGPSPTLLPPSMSSHRPSPEDSGSSDGIATPQTFQGQEYHPAIVNSNDPTLPQHEQYRKPATLTPSPQIYDKPMMPPRADSGFGPFHQAPGPMTALSQQMPHPSQTYPLQAGQNGRFTNGHVQIRPENSTSDMGRLEALVAVATSENRAAQEQT